MQAHFCGHVHTCATRSHTHFPNTSLFAPHTLPHAHKICLNYPGVLSPTCLLILLFLQKVFFFLLFLLCSYSVSLFLAAHAFGSAYKFSSLFPFLLGCFTQLRTVYLGKAWDCKWECLVGGRCVRCACVHSFQLIDIGLRWWGGLRERASENTGLMPHTGMAALYIVLMAATHCARFSQEVVYQS